MEEFILIFRHDDSSKIPKEEMDAWMKRATEWYNKIVAQNKFVKGNGLSFKDSKVVGYKNVVTDGPFGEIKETLGGYIIIKADSVEEAVEFAKACPVLEYEGNTVEVRKIAREDGIH